MAQEDILNLVENNPQQEYTLREIVEHVGLGRATVSTNIRQLVKWDRIKKIEDNNKHENRYTAKD